MKKTFRTTAFILIILMIALMAYLQFNPPLAHGSVGTTTDKQSVIVALGNKNLLGDIYITDVSINGKEPATNPLVQVSDSDTGFVISNTYNPYEGEYGMQDYKSIRLKPNSSPVPEDKKASAKDDHPSPIYGLSITEKMPIEQIEVSYRYLGLTFVTTINI
ncbi:hypothetical protein [Halobacillus sp. BBL2006]|uniref:hypothetical protein n=1 Tax=Halobacillus sp. BBL2006 TaxID=1543706 RepID=UPI0005420A09|nr:hypothetical protein [Halobacillus sp. BBL2006]KHE68359.1 hypothetical protein LD39_14760 [Halobacillus sp. BBL2006]